MPISSMNIPTHNTHNPPHSQPQSLPTFKAPAHKHAHHLHSIPPREKSTRTLIIDHMLWVHARTRFAQARAELGMTDRTGGPSSQNYTHRRRPENYDEDDEALSEGEDLLFLKTRAGWPGPTHDDDDAAHLSKQDLTLARSLRLRAEGLESVITSMLDQPPPYHPSADDLFAFSSSPSSSNSVRIGMHPHTLPNGVRLRLAFGTIINDLFARQAPPQPYRHTHPAKPQEDHPHHYHHHHHSLADLPEAILALVPISGAFYLNDHDHASPTSSTSPSPPSSSTLHHQPKLGYTTHANKNTHSYTPATKYRPLPSQRALSYYDCGNPTTSSSSSTPSLRCPRHLSTGCEVCVEARAISRSNIPKTSPSRVQQTTSSSSAQQHHNRTSSMGSNGASGSGTGPGLGPGHGPGPGPGPGPGFGYGYGGGGMSGGAITGWQDGSGIGSGLLRPGIKGSSLRRHVYDDEGKGTGFGNTKLAKLIPRFLRLSALVAVELGIEAKDVVSPSSNSGSGASAGVSSVNAGEGGSGERERRKSSTPMPSPLNRVNQTPTQQQHQRTFSQTSLSSQTRTPQHQQQHSHTHTPNSSKTLISPQQNQNQSQSQTAHQNQQKEKEKEKERRVLLENALIPTREWYMLLAGLLTRAVLEGYLTAGWCGCKSVESLLLVGIGLDVGFWERKKRRMGRRSRSTSKSRTRRKRGGSGSGSGSGGEEREREREGVKLEDVEKGVGGDEEREQQREREHEHDNIEEERGDDDEDDDDDDDDDDNDDDDDEDEDGNDEEDLLNFIHNEEMEFTEFDPDGLPSLIEAVRVLFPGLNGKQKESMSTSISTSTSDPSTTTSTSNSNSNLASIGIDRSSSTEPASVSSMKRKSVAEEEYEVEMYERLRRFYDIPNSTADLLTHMEDLAWSYPAEPVERSALRFCEAVAKWRGKPELETYKKKTPLSPNMGGMSIDSLVHSNPTSPVLVNSVVPGRTTATTTVASLGSMFQQTLQQHQDKLGQGRESRRKPRKPSIDVYFASFASTIGADGEGGSNENSPLKNLVSSSMGKMSMTTPPRLGGGGGGMNVSGGSGMDMGRLMGMNVNMNNMNTMAGLMGMNMGMGGINPLSGIGMGSMGLGMGSMGMNMDMGLTGMGMNMNGLGMGNLGLGMSGTVGGGGGGEGGMKRGREEGAGVEDGREEGAKRLQMR